MNILLFLLLIIIPAVAFLFRRSRQVAANIAGGTHAGVLSKRATAAIATRHLLVKFGATADLIEVNGANDKPLGPCPDEAEEAGDVVAANLLGLRGSTEFMVAAEAIAVGVDVFTAAGGKVQDLPAGAGTYYKVGVALVAADGDGDVLEVAPCQPVETVVS